LGFGVGVFVGLGVIVTVGVSVGVFVVLMMRGVITNERVGKVVEVSGAVFV